MSERDQAKDAGHAPRAEVAAPEQQAPESAAAGGLFGLPALMQSMELAGDMPSGSDVIDAETAQSADLLAHGGWDGAAIEGSGGLGGADEGEGGRMGAAPDAQRANRGARQQAAIDEAAARLRAAVAAGQGVIERAARDAIEAVEAGHADARARLDRGRVDAVGDLARTAEAHSRTARGARTMAERIGDDGLHALARAARLASSAIGDAADAGRESLAALEALHVQRLGRLSADEADEADEQQRGVEVPLVEAPLMEALRAVERTVKATLARIEAAGEGFASDVDDAAGRAEDRLARLVADVRYAVAADDDAPDTPGDG